MWSVCGRYVVGKWSVLTSVVTYLLHGHIVLLLDFQFVLVKFRLRHLHFQFQLVSKQRQSEQKKTKMQASERD